MATTHGMTHTREYHIWKDMLVRCRRASSKHYHRYGGRGIKVCERWKDFANFYADMGPRPSSGHTLDRKDNDGDYEPGNCRWATRKEQGRNRVTNRLVPVGEQMVTITEAGELLGINHEIIRKRLRMGWDVEKALHYPIQTQFARS